MSELEQKKQQIREELEKLKYEFKIELPKRISEAREYGDLKENAEYHAARERQSFVQARIAQLTEQLNKLNELNLSDIPEDKVAYGSTVTVVDVDTDDEVVFTFVSSNEVNPSEGKISVSSPIGAAMQNKAVGELVEVNIPAGKRKYKIIKLVTIHGKEFVA
ncbi:MAG TPA: transcription elongation factor GreA [Spirochaetota bacterium]|jgi:transcription elongation factor GreA|nr:transcription elongation factor GreA [Spirochaetota bacterium]OQA96622.1 MAG: Transcription elongation factor GreA [Spirochaetes bacterium ADurb.Bin218]HOK01798.1 transcription elongation factor GreA [Spirochaetota bacterium]HOK92007.1 transcription elongation factor GreA [Spirochaetota bacterium]HON15416.1 transcription elongation factor GreA [Spirochaetota bacterium]